jgi:hypothetical protein
MNSNLRGPYSVTLAALASLTAITIFAVQSEGVIAQNQTASTTGTVTNFTRLIEERFSFDRLQLGFTFPDLEVLYESPTTLVLRGKAPQPEFTSLGQVIDIAKQNGFKIDSVTVFTESSRPISGTVTLTDVYTVFMSRE